MPILTSGSSWMFSRMLIMNIGPRGGSGGESGAVEVLGAADGGEGGVDLDAGVALAAAVAEAVSHVE